MKKLLIITILSIIPFVINAQNRTDVKYVEFEIGAGFINGNKIDGGVSEIGAKLFFETRLNLVYTPFDVGFQAMLGTFNRATDYRGIDHEMNFRNLIVTFVDYNYRWKRVALFGGLGVGLSAMNHTVSWDAPTTLDHDTYFVNSFILNPRIGVELFNHVRFTLEYKLMRREYSFFGLSIGGVFGGGYKK
jgi:hypothetical protein